MEDHRSPCAELKGQHGRSRHLTRKIKEGSEGGTEILRAMNGMLSSASGNPPPPLNVQILPVQGQGRQGSTGKRSIECPHHQTEPNSVLDIRSPSPSSTRSSSLGGSTESGAAPGPFCEAVSDGHGHLPDPNVDENNNNARRSDGEGARRVQPQRTVSLSRKNKWGGEGSTRRPDNCSGEGSGMMANENRSGAVEYKAENEAVGAAAAEEGAQTDEWVAGSQSPANNEVQTMADKLGIEDLESMLLGSASPAPDHSLMRWLLGEIEDPFQHKDPSSPAHVKTGSDDGTGSRFSDAAGFGCPASLGTATPSVPAPPYSVLPALPRLPPAVSSNPRTHSHSHGFGGSGCGGLGLETGSSSLVPNVPCFQPAPGFFPPGVYDSNPNQTPFNPLRISAAAASPPVAPAQNNVCFPVSYAQQLQTFSDVVVVASPPPAKRHHGMPELVQSPSPLPWQPQESQPGWQALLQGGGGGLQANPSSVVKAEPRDTLVPLQRRLPQLQRQRGIISNNKVDSDEVQLTMVEQLLKAAEAVEVGNLGFAQAILARLNQHLSPLGKPLHRAAFYFKEALSSIVLRNDTDVSALSLVDIVHKISAYKWFSEVSPLSQFANFTANQALLESLKGAEVIHIIDFEIDLGGQWASFLQEIALQIGGSPALRLTAVGSNGSMEMHLTRENLCHFAKDLNISFEFNVVEVEKLECLTPAMLQLREREAIAVNFSLGMHRLVSSFSSTESITALLRLLKQFSPKAIVVVDKESERNGVSFAQQFLEALQFYSFLFDSLDAMIMNMDIIHKIEKFLLAPKIINVVAANCHSAPGKRTPPWRSLFIDAGLSPMAFSNFTEAQAEYLIRTIQGRGFEVIKTHESLLLVWQGRALVDASVWRC